MTMLRKRHTFPSVRNAAFLVIGLIGLIGLIALASRAYAAETREVLSSTKQPVPERSTYGRKYKSWTLFLVCNPGWALPQNESRLSGLYDEFQAFGMAIGPDNAAVWFRVSRDLDRQALVDVLRSAAFCESLKLPPSASPYILFTTEYPGAGRLDLYPASFPTELSSFGLISLAGQDADEITRLLTSLADQVLLNKMRNLDSQKEEWWRGLERSYEDIRSSIVGSSKGLTFRIKTPFFEVEKKS